jgi:mRNA-degrading endonuclease RelE of RelBE toxin-antitoxin system
VAYRIILEDAALEHLRSLSAGLRAKLAAALHSQLVHEPVVETRNRKRMDPDRRMYVAPWELRVGQLRVYYAVKEEAALVVVTKIGIKDRDRVIIGGERFEL